LVGLHPLAQLPELAAGAWLNRRTTPAEGCAMAAGAIKKSRQTASRKHCDVCGV